MDIATRLYTMRHGLLVGTDAAGNRYFTEKRPRTAGRARRWVIYAGAADASAVPPEWHAWLHYTVDEKLPETGRKPWQKEHQPNETGTAQAYRPPGHDYLGGNRAASGSDYEAWSPGT